MKKKKNKAAPDDTIYLTSNGTRVRIAKRKQYPIRPNDAEWVKEILRKLNEEVEVIRISDGHSLWGLTKDDLTPETP